MRTLKGLLLVVMVGYTPIFAQTPNELKYRIHIKKAQGKIVLDGLLNEPDWQKAEPTSPFGQQFPADTSEAVQQTQTRLTFDDQNIYLAYVVDGPRKYVVQSLKRDFPQGGGTDLIFVNFDTFKDKQNAFHFAVSPYGVQRDALISNGNTISNDWDNKWQVEVKNYDDKWIVEIAIPFKTIRYKVTEGINEWNVNFFRNNLFLNERSCWAQIPRGFPGNNIAFSGTLVWDTPPPRPGANVALIPYLLGGVSQDYLNNKPVAVDKNIGIDAKIAVTPSLNLDLTINPDFAQVEVDQQVTNLTRFELFFPERRQFFLENADLFSSFGFARVNPFFSRRIGLVKNPQTGLNIKNTIYYGARLSGKLDNNWRIGLLNMQTGSDDNIGVKGSNYTVATIQRRLFTRSNISAIVVNQQVSGANNYNRVVGLDYNLGSKNGFWAGKAFHHQMFTPKTVDGQFAQGLSLQYGTSKLGAELQLENIGGSYNPEVGFVPRNGYSRMSGNVQFNFFPKSSLINSFFINPDWDMVWSRKDNQQINWKIAGGTPNNRFLDWDAGLFGGISFQNGAVFSASLLRWDYTYLFGDFDPSGLGDTKKVLKAGTDYLYFSNRMSFQSNQRRRLWTVTQLRFGNYFNGRILSLNPVINYRYQPFALFSLSVNYNQIRLPQGFNDSDLWLISPRADITFSRAVFLTTFVQYNNQTNNMNVNARFQWRFKPVSDLFVVYTDNYFTQDFSTADSRFFTPFQSKNRAIVLKLTYWLNV